ncbi:MAG TPA: 4'-phosphopantetheinyl transferase superfamily protein [Pyrinomonadaceae bacterium]|nr:4'-phosphopantetheinyl transferase superfamily protein [Pyrinomonadaceae bacterium]
MSQFSTWSAPPQTPSLQKGEVHVWRIELEQSNELLEKFRVTLDPDELERARRFHFEKHRRHFIVGRGFLRDVLSRYLKIEPGALIFSYGAYGKPALAGEHENSKVRFNMSHSHNLALLAITEEKHLGIDIEHIRSDFASGEIARRFFSRIEVESFNALQPGEQVAAFFRCWTRKEAFMKATGKGMSQPLDAFDVTLAPAEPPALLRVEDDDASRWSLSDIDVGEGYAGALVVEGIVSKMKHWSATD